MQLYERGALKEALKLFVRALKLNHDFSEADDMRAQTQELLELKDMADLNMTEKNYEAVVEISTEAIEIDKANYHVTQPFYYQRGSALFQLGKTSESMMDYSEFDRITKIILAK